MKFPVTFSFYLLCLGCLSIFAQGEKKLLPVVSVCDGSSDLVSDWTELGPTHLPSHCMGRINAIAALPAEPDIVYAGGAFGGGIFRTKNASAANPTWECITDAGRFKTGIIGDIIIDPTMNAGGVHDIFFVCELGIFKSTDNGSTWNLSLPLTHDDKERHLLMDPSNHRTLYMLEKTEIHRTTDGGASWQSLGFSSFLTNPEELHWIVTNPLNTKILYVSGNGNHLYRYDYSRSPSWSDCTSALTSIDSVPAGTSASFRLAVAGKNMYVLCKNANTPSKVQLYKSTDGGYSWSAHNESQTGLLGSTFIVSPNQQDVMYLGDGYPGFTNRRILKSIDGGKHFFFVSNYYPSDLYNKTSTHGDVRALKLIESTTTNGTGDDDFIIAGDDGGVLYSHSSTTKHASYVDGKQPVVNWTDINGTGLSVAQFHGIGGIENDPEYLVGGVQDDGVHLHNEKWSNSWGCDAYETIIDPNHVSGDRHYVYSQKDCGGGITLWSSNDGGQQFTAVPLPPGIVTGGKKSMQIVKSTGQFYIAYHDLYKSNTPTLKLTGDSSRMTDFTKNYSVPSSWQAAAFEVCETNPQVIYYGFGGSLGGDAAVGKKIFKTTNAGKSWDDITDVGNDQQFSLAGVRSFNITCIAMNPDNPDEIYVGFDGFTSPENIKYRVMRSLDGGVTWNDYSEGLAEYPVHCMKFQKGSHTLYIGTWTGVFARKTNDPSSPWECFNRHLPVTAVYDLEINYCAQKIRAGTFGRGLWESPLAANEDVKKVKKKETWKGNLDVMTDIIIESKGALTITGTVNIAKGKKIVVKPGGQLILDGGTLTNACSLSWQGIELWGTGKKSTSPKSYGRFQSIHGAKIEQAVNEAPVRVEKK